MLSWFLINLKNYIHKGEYSLQNSTTWLLARFFLNWSYRISLLIDVGSGTGNLTKELEQYVDCEKIIGLDNSQAMNKYAQDNYGSENIVFTYGDICEPLEQLVLHLNKPAGSCDVVTSIYCLHWVSNQKSAIENISSLLKPGNSWHQNWL